MDYLYDLRRYSFLHLRHDKSQILAWISIHYHKLEKGLAMPHPDPAFGEQTARQLMALVRKLSQFADPLLESHYLVVPRRVLAEYFAFKAHRGPTSSITGELSAFLKEFGPADPGGGGTLLLRSVDVLQPPSLCVEHFFRTRHSIRNFSSQPVDHSSILHAIRLAQQSPSVCNRQTARVHALFGKRAIDSALKLQSGNRGFGHLVPVLLVVSSDSRFFVNSGERNQGWIDGGMFAMSLVYALHGLGLGTCCLNWSVSRRTDEELKRALAIPRHEMICMLVAVGHLPETIRVAASPRLALESILRVL